MLALLVAMTLTAPDKAEVFVAAGRSVHGSYVSEGGSDSDGYGVGLGLAFPFRPSSGLFSIVPRIDGPYVFTGDRRMLNAHVALMFGTSWEHLRVVIGPSIHAPISFGLSIDVAALLDPVVVGVFADLGLVPSAEARAGVRAGIMF